MQTNRRTLLRAAGALAAGTAFPALGRGGLVLDDPADFLTAIAKMRGALDERLVISYVIGARYAVPEHRTIPMMGILAATFSVYRRVAPDRFEARSLEIAFFTDMQTGRMIERWKNPVTDVVVDVPQTRMGPATITMTASGIEVPTPAGEAAGLELVHVFQRPVVNGDHVWITEEIHVDGAPRGPGGRPFIYNEFSTYHARRTALEDPELAAVPTDVQYQSLITYRPWMGFGDAPGHTLARGAGKRVERVEDLPAYYLELAERYHPEVLDDPLAALAPSAA